MHNARWISIINLNKSQIERFSLSFVDEMWFDALELEKKVSWCDFFSFIISTKFSRNWNWVCVYINLCRCGLISSIWSFYYLAIECMHFIWGSNTCNVLEEFSLIFRIPRWTYCELGFGWPVLWPLDPINLMLGLIDVWAKLSIYFFG